MTVGRDPRAEDGADLRAIEVMRNEIAMIPDVIADQIATLRRPLRELARSLPIDLTDVVLTGCGDSHFAGIATRLAFERAAGIRCRPAEALELTRYEVRYVPVVPAVPLLVAVSYSGEVGRTIEAAISARTFGWRTVALTGHKDGRLAAAVDGSVLMQVPTLGFSPGTSTYVAMVTALLTFAAELARARGRLEDANDLDAALGEAPGLAATTLARSGDGAQEFADVLVTKDLATFLGAGPSRASAAFGAAKLFEGPQRYGVVQDLEEWAHEQFFVSGAGTPIVVVAPSGASRDRAAELLAEMAFIEATVAVVGDRFHDPAARSASIVLETALTDEMVSPLLTCLPLALVAFHLSTRLGTTSYGFRSPEHEREHYETIHRATLGEPA